HGFESKETIAAIHRHDERLGKIIQALKDSGLYEESTIIALGDHSALSENKAIQLNVLFHQKGLISINSKGKLVDWNAYCQSCDGSAYVYVKDKNDTDTIREIQLLLEELLQNKQNGTEFIL
ncbi:alkaline phosphatase family protein, partial [Bacillus cereus]|uniref:alkaline phosphatase family protein n=1 Tax=Bacillus cereus TaxID=1396 RepID=UPI000C00DF4A